MDNNSKNNTTTNTNNIPKNDTIMNNNTTNNNPNYYRRKPNENRAMNDDQTLHDGSVEDYEREVKDLIDEFKKLSVFLYFKLFFKNFSKIVDNASHNDVSRENLIPLIYRRNEYLREIHGTKETCPIC